MTQAKSQHIDLSAVFEALERPLGLVEDPERRSALQRYLGSARVHLERAVFDLPSGAVEAVNEAGAAEASPHREAAPGGGERERRKKPPPPPPPGIKSPSSRRRRTCVAALSTP